jgi:hypothetical protein
MLLFEAIGGSGKSMLTWEWLTKHCTTSRGDWAGRFWYSFYEKGAVMATFCRQALAYMTKKPTKNFVKLRMPELSDRLFRELERRPWLIVLDGLERILVAYHRFDAAQLPDEEADTTADHIAKRGSCEAIRPEDDDLLRRLVTAAPSKILISSRLRPLALVNRCGSTMPGVRRESLPGLRPRDAEEMLRACGVDGDSQAIQRYLQQTCDCHPLVIGALAGLINNYVSDPGNFDQWIEDPNGGGAMDLADLDLVHRRNHILSAAIDALPMESSQLLGTLALLSGGADFETVKAFNPHAPLINKSGGLGTEVNTRQALAKLENTIHDLGSRGLLQYDRRGKKSDLHPVVRGVAAGKNGETGNRADRAESHRSFHR